MLEGRKCKITNFGEPHLFFVTYDDNQRALFKIETVLKERFVDSTEQFPKADQIYVIKHEGKYKRIIALTKSKSYYFCWLIDYGELVWEKTFYTLPPGCDAKPLSIKAGLNKTVYLETYIGETGKAEYRTSSKFSSGACSYFKNQIRLAKEIYFKEELVVRNIHFGEIYFVTNDGSTVNLIESARKNKIITVDEKLFSQMMAKYTQVMDYIKKLPTEEGIGRGCSRNSRKLLAKPTVSSEDQVKSWLASTSHEISVLLDNCAKHPENSDTDSNSQTDKENTPTSKSKPGLLKNLREKMRESLSGTASPPKSTGTNRSSNSSILSPDKEVNSISSRSSCSGTSSKESENAPIETFLKESDSEEDSQFDNEKSTVKKFRCKCRDCTQWDEMDFDSYSNTEEFKTRKVKCVVRPGLLLREGDEEGKIPTLKSLIDLNEFSAMKKMSVPNVLAHGTVTLFPQKYVTDVMFIEQIHRSLRALEHRKCMYVQQYGWPAIMRSMNLCLINVPRSGKTMTYVPAICSFLMEPDRYRELPNEDGPKAVVLCNESRDVEKVYNRFHDVYTNTRSKIRLKIVQAIAPLNPALMSQFKSACDVLITTPAVLITLLLRNTFSLKRLCHLVVEDIDEMFCVQQPLERILKVVQEMLTHRTCAKQVQFVCTAQHWTFPIENLMKELNSVPLIVIGNPIEAALYGRSDISIVEVQTNTKQYKLYDIIKDNYRIYKTLVVCKQEDIEGIQKLFQLYGISMLIADDHTRSEDVLEIHKSWCSRSGGEHVVLICTDFVLTNQMNVRDCAILINYSLKITWNEFVRRWSCLIDNYKCPLNDNQDSFTCKIYVFIDENSGKEITKIINYFQTVGITLPSKITDFCQEYYNSTEKQKINDKCSLCSNYKQKTVCTAYGCLNRHTLDPNLDSPHTKISGTLKFQIDFIYSVNRYLITPLQFEAGKGEVHKFTSTRLEIERILESTKIKELAMNIEVGEMYLFEEDGKYIRCVVKRIIDRDSTTKCPLKVVIEGVDVGCCKRVSTMNLFKVPDNLKTIPSSLMELIIANITPLNKEKYWSDRARKQLEHVFEEHKKPNIFCTGRVALHLGNTVWMENYQILTQLTNLRETVTCFTLLPFLIRQNLAKVEKGQLERFYKDLEKCGLPKPEYDLNAEVKAVVKQAKPQWAFLPAGGFTAVTFSSGFTPTKFFVKLKKFSVLYKKFEESIQELIQQRVLNLKPQEIIPGNCYLVPDPDNEAVYARAIVTSITEETADCFYVDYGDVAYISLKDIKFIPDEYITRLPFQCIECSLHGVDPVDGEWTVSSVDLLYEYCSDSTRQYFRTLYTLAMKEEKGSYGGNTKYTIQLYDNSENVPKLINAVMIDCGFAVTNEDDPLDLTAKLEIEEEKCESDGDESLNGTEKGERMEDELSDDGSFDFVYLDKDLFFNEVGLTTQKKVNALGSSPASSSQRTENSLPKMKALPASDTFTPVVEWHQTDEVIKVWIKMSSVEDYELKLIAGRVLSFSTQCDDKKYTLELQLFNPVNKSMTHKAGAFSVNVTLRKIKRIEWPRLILPAEPNNKIRYNLEKLVVSEDEDEIRPLERVKRWRKKNENEEIDDDDGEIAYYDEIGSDLSDSDLSNSFDSDEN